jgi:uncharacterized protein (DUF58 family)
MSDTPAPIEKPNVDAAGVDAALLTPELLYAIRPLSIRARTIAQGVLVGAHMSRRFGSSSEFAEYKLYAPGDELKHLDWKAYARFDRYFVRRYLEEANLDLHLVVDSSASMAYAGGARGHFTTSKWNVARTLAAAVATIAHDQSDATGISVFSSSERFGLPPRSRRDHLAALLDGLERLEPTGQTDVEGALASVLARLNRRALVVVISDFLDVDTRVLETLGVLRRRGADVLVLQVMHRDELEFPFDGVVRFEDLEGERQVQVDAPGVRAAYLDEIGAFLARWRDGAMSRDVRYALAPADVHPVAILKAGLATARSAR